MTRNMPRAVSFARWAFWHQSVAAEGAMYSPKGKQHAFESLFLQAHADIMKSE